MRIQYTLPGLIPTPTPNTGAPPEQFPGTFSNTIRRIRTPAHTNWRRMLRLDKSHGSTFGPPPKPPGLEMRNAAGERLRWRHIIERGVQHHASSESINRMLQLLSAYQRQEGSIAARSVNETRG